MMYRFGSPGEVTFFLNDAKQAPLSKGAPREAPIGGLERKSYE